MADDRVVVRIYHPIDKLFPKRFDVALHGVTIGDDLLNKVLDRHTMITPTAVTNLCASLLDPLCPLSFGNRLRDAIKNIRSSVSSRSKIDPANRFASHADFVRVACDLIRRYLPSRQCYRQPFRSAVASYDRSQFRVGRPTTFGKAICKVAQAMVLFGDRSLEQAKL